MNSNPSPNPNPNANPNKAELAALFELLGDGGGIDGHGAPDADVDSVTIGYEEFCDLLKRLDPEWQEDQLDDALMALVGDLGQATDQEAFALPAKSTASRHFALDTTHAAAAPAAPDAAPAAAPTAAAAAVVAVAGKAAGGVSEASRVLTAGRQLASHLARQALGGAAQDAAGAWLEGDEALLQDRDIFVLLERETKELLPMARPAPPTQSPTPNPSPNSSPNPGPNPSRNPGPQPWPQASP